MPSYRPICDVWILARPKVKYYGAFLGASLQDPVLHVCAGHVRAYPGEGFGPHDRTLDLDPGCAPDFLADAREPLPAGPWRAVLIDRPYTPEDADRYSPGRAALPEANALLRAALEIVPCGCRVGILDYVWPQPPVDAREVAVVAVGTERNNRARWYTVFTRRQEP